jgi:FlaA1/EpsC-like NDP-sugar epimerase
MRITDIAHAIHPRAKLKIVGIRPGEKLHEEMVSTEDAPFTYEYTDFYKILPAIHNWNLDPARIDGGALVSPEFTYRSDTNSQFMKSAELQEWIKKNLSKIGGI